MSDGDGDGDWSSSPNFTPPPTTSQPNPHRPRTPMAARLHSPLPPQHRLPHLGSNDDQLERAQARAALRRRRKSLPSSSTPSSAPPDLLDHHQIMDLFHNCIKLASENKINQKNTWELTLIDHLSEIVRTKPEDDDETNFQKASCTLEAGVKIYSMRVDSVHSEAYKVLGGINRAGRDEDKESTSAGEDAAVDQGENLSKKQQERKLSPLSTLESSFEALNVKKFDAAFTVDPLYHQTSAQFDEGGAKGLLLNNLGVYGGCRVLFDSFEVPEKCMLYEAHNDKSELIDLSFLKECIGEMMRCMPLKNDISPTLRDIVNHFDEDNRRPSNVIAEEETHVVPDDVHDNHHAEFDDGNAFDDCKPWSLDQDDLASVVDDNSTKTYPNFESHSEENGYRMFQDSNLDTKLEKLTGFLTLGLGFTSHSNAWAGPDHWKYQKSKEHVPVTSGESELPTKKVKKSKVVSDLEFTSFLDKEMVNIFAPPKNPKSLLLPVSKTSCNFTLPEDCHYRPESLVKLFVLPNVTCLGKLGRKLSDESRQDNDTSSPLPSWDNVGMNTDQFDDVNADSDTEDLGTLVSQPRQVNKVDIQYDKLSKQVDVHALKDMLWNQMRESSQTFGVENEATTSLRQVLCGFRNDHQETAPNDISPHLFFICLLHLANEHCLSIHDRPSLDELDIHIPASAIAK